MSALTRFLPWLFEDDGLLRSLALQAQHISQSGAQEKQDLIARVGKLLPGLRPKQQDEVYEQLMRVLRELAEDHVTEVRVALSSTLKDTVHLPHDLVRKLANDAERAVAEPILRFSRVLSDDDLMEIIQLFPQSWQALTIADRSRVTEPVSEALFDIENQEAHRILISNDGAIVTPKRMGALQVLGHYAQELKARASLKRRLRREWMQMTDRALYLFLRQNAHLSQSQTQKVLKKTHQKIDTQEQIKDKPNDLDDPQLRDALALGETDSVLQTLSERAQIPLAAVKKMVDSDSPRAIIALTVRAGLSMRMAILLQQKLCRLPPAKILYPRNGDECPLNAEELRWQYEFYGLQN